MRGMIQLSYWVGVFAAALAVVYKTLMMFGVGESWPAATGLLPRSFVHLSVLLFLLCLATEVYARNRTAG